MVRLFVIALTLVMLGCGKKKWDKDYITSKCLKSLKGNAGAEILGEEKTKKLCDCMADKMLVKYKSEAEADKDKAYAEELAAECAGSAFK